MINIKYAFKGLISKPFFTILTVIQLIFCIVLLYISMCYQYYVSSSIDKLIGVFNIKNKTFYSINLISEANDHQMKNNSLQGLIQFDNYINKNNNKFTYISYSNDGKDIKLFDGYEDYQINPSLPLDNYNGDTYVMLRNLRVSERFVDNFKLRIIKGRNFQEDDFKLGEVIPVILGYNFINKFSLGQEIDCTPSWDNIKKLKVIGFLDKDSYFLQTDQTLSPREITTLNNYIISPSYFKEEVAYFKSIYEKDCSAENEANYKIYICMKDFSGCLLINDTNTQSLTTKEIEDTAKSYGLNLKCDSMNNYIDDFKSSYVYETYLAKTFAGAIFAFTIIGMIVATLNSLLRRKKEFGIHIMHGGTLTDISKRIVFEQLMLMIFSFLFALFFIKIIFNNNQIFSLNTSTVINVLFILICLSLLTSVIPVIKVARLNVNDLIRGKE